MMNNKKKKKKVKETPTPVVQKLSNRVTYTERNIGFSIEIPDTWVEVKKDSYENLGISESTLFAFVVDEFTSITAMFGGFADKRKFNKVFAKTEFKGHSLLYQKEEEYDKVPVKYLVLDGGNKKVLNAFTLINGMIINFTINLSNKKIFDNNKLYQDPNYKLLAKILSNIKVLTPINPPVFVSVENINPTEPISVRKINAKQKTTAQISIEVDCKYKNIVVPDYYFKYVYRVDNDVVMLSVINDEVYFAGLKDEFVYVKDDTALAKRIHRILSIYWDDLAKYDVGFDKPHTNSYWSMKNKDAYLLIPMDENTTNVLSGIFNEIVMCLEEESQEDFLKYDIFPDSKEKLKKIQKEEIKAVNYYEMNLEPVFKEGIEVKKKAKKEEPKPNKYIMDLAPVFDKEIKVNKDKVNKYALDLKDTVVEEEKEETPTKEESNETTNVYAFDFEELFNEEIEVNPEKLEELKEAREEYAYDLDEVNDKDLEDPNKEIVSEHIVLYGQENRYSLDINSDPDQKNEVTKKREFDVMEYNLDDYEEYYHNISGHGLFKFLFPKGSGIKVLRDFNVFDIQNQGLLSFRVFLFKCDTEEAYKKKLNDWMKKNFESDNYALLDKYESSANNVNVMTYLLNNGRFYKVAYLYGYLVAISAVNTDDKMLQANIALENLEVGESNNQFIESYDRKMNTINLLQEQGIPYNIDLPPIPSSYEINGKTFEEVAKRAIVLSIVCNFASDIVNNSKKKYLKESKKFFNKLLDTFNVRDAMIEEEKELFNKMDKDLAMQISWQFEGNLILMWCLGLIEEIPFPDVLVDPDEITSIVSSCGSYKEFTEKCLFRDVQDVLDLADLIYRYDWYCVECESQGLEPTINPEVVIERHRAINWLLTQERWDNVEINT